jgi:ABC-type nitrate/sulfonate/bicarbonate transport system permease component
MNVQESLNELKKGYFTRKNVIKLILLFSSIPLFIAFWWILALYLEGQGFYYLPPPDIVLDALIQSLTFDPATRLSLGANIYSSLVRFLFGFVIALAVGVPLGLAIGYSGYADALARPTVELLRPIPPIAWVPFLLLSLGLFWGPIITIFIGVFFPILSNVIFGVKSVDPLLIDAAKTQGASDMQIFTKVIFPSSVPYIMTGIKIGLGVGWMCIVAAEIIAAEGGGVGAIITGGQSIGRYDIMFAGMVTIALLGLATLGISTFFERRVRKWMGME